MRPETQGKIMVAMVVSIVAFGLGTGAILVSGQFNSMNPALTFNSTPQGDLPVIYDTSKSDTNSGKTSTVTNPSTSTSGSSSSSGSSTSGGQSNQNTNTSSSNSTSAGN